MRLALWPRRALVGVVALAVCGAIGAYADQNSSQDNFGVSFFSSEKPCKIKDVPTFEALIPIPGFVDPFAQDIIPGFCQFFVDKKDRGISNVRVKYETELYVLDNTTGEFETFPIGKGQAKTDSSGSASFDFDLPAELFADGFESGDVSAWSYTRADFRKGGRTDAVSGGCGVGAKK